MVKIEVNGEKCGIHMMGDITDISRDVVFALEKMAAAIEEHDKNSAGFFRTSIALIIAGRAIGYSLDDILNKMTETDEDLGKVSFDDLMNELKEHRERKE